MPATRRLVDLLMAAAMLASAAPLLLVLAVAIWLEDGRPVFFRQARIGRDGAPFRIWKFRTMRAAPGPLITAAGDPRITRTGRLLRRAKLDELPQLLNVLAGTMAMVGPRPEVQRYVDLYDPAQREVLRLTPGITDPASLAFFNEEAVLASAIDPERLYVDRIMPEKIRLNLAYAQGATVRSDVGVVLATVRRLAGTGRTRVPGKAAGPS